MVKDLIAHCAPTLADIKTANMFNYRFSSKGTLAQDIHNVNIKLNPKGVFAVILHTTDYIAKIFVYRLSRLTADLAQDDAQMFLAAYGYQTFSANDCIYYLKKRFLSYHEFPHEIGLFLGYPLHDVIGFIQNEGKNSKHTGNWKVYHDENSAVEKFAMYQNCKKVYQHCFSQGEPIEHLVV